MTAGAIAGKVTTVPLRGRFAPTPSGALHAGSLMVAVASFLAARSRGGEWHVRIDDLDPARTVPGAADEILRSLEAHALTWDGPVVYQSRRREAHAHALRQLDRASRAYPCECTRREVSVIGDIGPEGPIYPGTCRSGLRGTRPALAWRMRTDGPRVAFDDTVVGPVAVDVEAQYGDFIIWRADDVPGYQLASAVDDIEYGFNQIVRGADLLASSVRQIAIRHLLTAAVPEFAHLPLLRDRTGLKLGKSTGALPVDDNHSTQNLCAALSVLGLVPARELNSPEDLLREAIASFSWRRIQRAVCSPPPAS